MTPDQYLRVKELFARVVDLTDEERDRILDVECGDDHGLRGEVESLLRHDDPRTIIRADDSTVPNPASRTLPSRRFKLGRVTENLGPRGLLALGGLLSCVLLALLGSFEHGYLRERQRELRREALNEIVDAKVVGLRMWLDHESEKARSWARSSRLRESIVELVKSAGESEQLPISFGDSTIEQEIQREITTLADGKEHFTIWDRRFRLIADSISGGERIGRPATPWGSSILAEVFDGKTKLFSFDRKRSITELDDFSGVRTHLAIVTPIRDEMGRIIAALQVHDKNGQAKLSEIVRTNRLGKTGETYVFNHEGLMLTASRFDEQMRQAGWLPQSPDDQQTDLAYLRDPGGNLTSGYQSDAPRASLPLTKMARLCISGNDGDDLDGYRDYRGVPVVGAWRWLEDLQIGVATELDINEADPSIRALRSQSIAIFLMFACCLCVAVGSLYSVQRLRESYGEFGKLGPYRLGTQIGEGGMGKVFKAQHELLKRPTAVKLLKPEIVDRDGIARFEREAQLASQLEHFNTVRIFDYGVSDKQVFYLVMEYIDGLTLAQLISRQSAISPGRTVMILRQILFSLREAHQVGVVHRDLKPGNVMVCVRGGVSDVVKVLDFGLVKPIETTKSQEITEIAMVAGTPQYLAPERLSDPETNDPRSDLYAVGAIAFYLLTGRSAVQGHQIHEILYHLANVPPTRPSAVADQAIPPALDDLVLRCLAKGPNLRPESAQAILEELDQLTGVQQWTQADADAWWETYRLTTNEVATTIQANVGND